MNSNQEGDVSEMEVEISDLPSDCVGNSSFLVNGLAESFI